MEGGRLTGGRLVEVNLYYNKYRHLDQSYFASVAVFADKQTSCLNPLSDWPFGQ